MDPYKIISPVMDTGRTYSFVTDSGVQYEVQFGRKSSSVLDATIVFGVLNDEFEGEEYVNTNRGEQYRVMATVTDIIKMYMKRNPLIRSFEFSGEHSPKEVDVEVTSRTKIFSRYAHRIFGANWHITLTGNKVIAKRERE